MPWSAGDTRPSQLERERTTLTNLATEFEAGGSSTSSHALWNSAWYPLAISSIEVHAFDPVGCFGGSPEQVVSFDFSSGGTWCVFPTITSWFVASFANRRQRASSATIAEPVDGRHGVHAVFGSCYGRFARSLSFLLIRAPFTPPVEAGITGACVGANPAMRSRGTR